MVWHHMSFQYLYSLILAQCSDYLLQVCSILIVYDLPSVFRNEHYVVLAHPFRMCQTACLVYHKFSFHCRNRLDILLYHVRRIFGITFVAHPLSGWLSVSLFVLNLPKGIECEAPESQTIFGGRCFCYSFIAHGLVACGRVILWVSCSIFFSPSAFSAGSFSI